MAMAHLSLMGWVSFAYLNSYDQTSLFSYKNKCAKSIEQAAQLADEWNNALLELKTENLQLINSSYT